MVTRKAILIGNSGGYRNLSLLKGVEKDLDNYYSFLLSKVGGEWLPEEIRILKDVNSIELIDVISHSVADYTFVVFCGHGTISTYTATDTISLVDIDLQIGKLVNPSKKQTIVIDACGRANIPNGIKTNVLNSIKLEQKEKKEISTRIAFDEAIIKNSKGLILLFSGFPNDVSGDGEVCGGYFSYSLIKAGLDWGNKEKQGNILTLDNAVDNAKIILNTSFTTKQRPEMSGQIRRLTFPPFAVGTN